MGKSYRDKDLEVLKKIYDDRNNCYWKHANLVQAEYNSINFPKDAEMPRSIFACEYRSNFTVFTGLYSVRFYYDEDKYNYERRTFVAFVRSRMGGADCIAFMSNEDILGSSKSLLSLYSNTAIGNELLGYKKRLNLIDEIFNSANYIANKVDELYQDILGEDDDEN
ncbi:hypothetical protein [Bacillus pumilus]|uniref:hypothetical protein n=1 Tax=Bacillus pumilus TaxID=1408 RepID=UPI0011A9C27E|nr:hypothetical protein [Bacillus pumilus]